MNNNYLSSLLKVSLILAFFLEVSCEPTSPFPRCVSADNFGLEAVAASAYYPKGSEIFKAKDGDDTSAFSPNQVIQWIDTGLITNGEPIKVRTNGMWTAWAKSNKKYSPVEGIEFLGIENGKIEHVKNGNGNEKKKYEVTKLNQSVIPLDRICGPYSIKDSMTPGCSDNKCQCIDDGLKDDVKKGAYGAPCWFRNGYGAYLLLKRDGDPDPNETVNTMRFPKSPVVHLGYKSTDEGGPGVFSSTEHPIKDASCQNLELQQGWKIYIKILDRYYWDNAGGYSFEFISGVRQERGLMIFETIRKKVKYTLITQGGEAIFKRIVVNDSFKSLVRSLLVLFLMISALLYILGMVQQPMPDFLTRILKISLVLMLISPNSWQFFYDNLLSLFINGTDAIIGMINGHSGMRSYNQDAPFAFLDYMIRDKIFSPIVWGIKMRALIVSEFLGIFGVLFIIVVVLIYVFLCIYAFAIYLAGLIGISLLIALMPIFFIGILFSKFKSLFDGWLTQCISFSLQSIMIFTLLSLFGSLIMNTYYRLLGFTVCYNKWMKVKLCVGSNDDNCLLNKSFYDWTPGQKYVPKVINIFGKSNVCDSLNCSYDSVSRFTFTGGGAVIPVPPEYTEKDFRYIDYPYFDPDTTGSNNPDGVSVKENSKFTELANLLNSLMALPTINGDGIARLVENIKSEINNINNKEQEQEVKNKLSKALSEIENSQMNNIPKDYGQLQKDVKNTLILLISSDKVDSTPKGELEKQYDYSIIKKIRKGYLIIWEELLILFLLALLISLMRSFVTNIGSLLGGGSPMSTMLSRVWDGILHRDHHRQDGGKVWSFINSFGGLKHKLQDYHVATLGLMLLGRKVSDAVVHTVKRTPILGTAVKFTSEVADAVTMPDSDELKFQRKFDKQLKKLTYYRAVIGSHLRYSGFDALKHLGKYTVDRISGEKQTELWQDVKLQHNHFMQKLREEILGPEKDKLSPYLPPKDPEGEESPFPRSKSIDVLDLNERDADIGIDNDVERPITSDGDIDRNAVQDFDQHGIRLDKGKNLELREGLDNKPHADISRQLPDKLNDSKLKPPTEDGESSIYPSDSEEISRGSTHDISTLSDDDSQEDLETEQDDENLSSGEETGVLTNEDENLEGPEKSYSDKEKVQSVTEDHGTLQEENSDVDLSPKEEIEVPRDDDQLQTNAYEENSDKENLGESRGLDEGEVQSVIQDDNSPQKENFETLEDISQADNQSQQNLSTKDRYDLQQQNTGDELENSKEIDQKLLQNNDQMIEGEKSSNGQKKGTTTEEKLDKLKEGQNKRKEIEDLRDKMEQIKKQQEDRKDEN